MNEIEQAILHTEFLMSAEPDEWVKHYKLSKAGLCAHCNAKDDIKEYRKLDSDGNRHPFSDGTM